VQNHAYLRRSEVLPWLCGVVGSSSGERGKVATIAWGIWEHKLYPGWEEVAFLMIHPVLTAFLWIVEL